MDSKRNKDNRKVFISVLGTGFYAPCKYRHGDTVMDETRFIQKAMLDAHHIESWSENDAICILLTQKARSENWDIPSGERLNSATGKAEAYQGLRQIISGSGLKAKVYPLDIPDGGNETEMWKIFNTLYNFLEQDDELYFDLTHSFRYLPMLVLVLGNYAKFMKGTRIVAMSYGNYEAREHSTNEAPIINLMPLSALQEWTDAAAAFKKFGKMDNMSKSIDVIRKGDFSDMGKKQRASYKEALNRLNKNMTELERQISTCRGNYLYDSGTANEVRKSINSIRQTGKLPEPAMLVLDEIDNVVSPLAAGGDKSLTAVIEWCKTYGMLQQAYTLGQESIVTMLCNRFSEFNPFADKTENGEKTGKERQYRDYMSALLGINGKVAADESKWTGKLAEKRELTHAFLNLEWMVELRKRYGQLTNNRNTINHGGFTGKIEAKDLDNQKDYISDCLKIISGALERPVINSNESSGRILINLSNHPFEKWDKRQKEAALEYGECVDCQFPAVDPDMGKTDIDRLADCKIKELYRLAGKRRFTVHIMGEMGLTYAIVSKLKQSGIPCILSTSFRIAKEDADGLKHVRFNFERFREY